MDFIESQWISLKIKHFDGFFRFHEIHENSKCDHDGYTHLELRGDVFILENARFRLQRRLKSLNLIFIFFNIIWSIQCRRDLQM